MISDLHTSNLNPKMYRLALYSMLILFSSCYQTAVKNEKSIIYQENNTYEVFKMPNNLKEISGVTFINDSIVAAIEDETGTLYFYNLNQKAVVRKGTFAEDGDYEDITRNGDILYIVKSNGDIFEVSNFNAEKLSTKKYKTKLKGKNDIEGICYDEESKSLLLAIKEKNLGKDKDDKEHKNIYQFVIRTEELKKDPVYQINLKTIEKYFEGDKITEASKKFLKAIGNKNLNNVFKTSSITFHPITKELYVLSSINKIIIVMDKESNIKKIIPLNGSYFSQPEGIAFDSNGTLFVSNEGHRNAGNIIKINNPE